MLDSRKSRSAVNKVYFSVLANNIRKNGFLWVLKRSLYRCLRELAWIILLPISVTLHLLGFRRLLIRVEHIGHLATEFDTFIKSQQLGLRTQKRYFVLVPKEKVSNMHLLNYWRSYVTLVENSRLCAFLEIVTKRFFVRDDASDYAVKFFGTQPIYRINQLWGDRPPLLQLNQDDENWSSEAFSKLGISKNQWFVCLHVREGGFLPHNELIQSHRNASIDNAALAIKEIIQRGGVVVRMGDPSMIPFASMPGVIDYAHHPLKSDRMDVVLCAKAKFFLGCTSGLAFLSMIFGVPVAHANMIPVETLGLRPCDISIPKLLWSEALRRDLSFREILSSEIGGFFFTQQYKDAGIHAKENTPEEILMLAREMLDRLEDKFIESKDDAQLHAQYMSLFKPGHYSYGAASKVSIAFLRNYQYLLSV